MKPRQLLLIASALLALVAALATRRRVPEPLKEPAESWTPVDLTQ